MVGSTRRSWRVVAVCALTVGGLTACANVPRPASGTPVPRPALSQSAATAVFAHYDTVNDKANAARSARLISTVEGGDLAARSRAEYRIQTLTSAAPVQPLLNQVPVVFAPQAGPYPRFAMVTSEVAAADNKIRPVLSVFLRERAALPWLRVLAVNTGDRVPPPELVRGLATVVPSDATGLAAGPQEVGDLLGKALMAPKGSAELSRFAVSPSLTEWRTELERARSDLGKAGTVTRQVESLPDVYALRAKGGGALVAGTISWREFSRAKPGFEFSYDKASVVGKLLNGAITRSTLTYQGAYVASVPPDGGKITLLALQGSLMDAAR